MHTASIKRIACITAVALTSTLVWATAKPWLESPFRFSGYSIVLWPALTFTLASAVTGLAWMLLESRMDRLAAILASWATFILFWRPDIWYLSMLPVFAGLWYLAARRIRVDVLDRHKVRVMNSLGTGMMPLMLGTCLMLSLGFYLLPAYHTVDARDVSVGLQSQIDTVYGNPLIEAQLSQLPDSMQAQVKSDLTKTVDGWVKRFLGPLGPYLPPLLAFGLFLVLWSFLFMFRELAIWLGALLFMALKATRFVSVQEQEVKAEVLVL